MKQFALTASAVLVLILSQGAIAESHTVTLGYAQSKVQGIKDIKGGNVKYHYELGQSDEPFSIIASLSYLSGNKTSNVYTPRNVRTDKVEIKYYSLAAGPAYRINSVFSVYGLVGAAYNKADVSAKALNYAGTFRYGKKNTYIVYGAGLQINPVGNLTIDIGYEGSQMKLDEKKHDINGFNVGFGYRF